MQSYKDAVYLLPDSKSHDSQLFDAGKSSLEGQCIDYVFRSYIAGFTGLDLH